MSVVALGAVRSCAVTTTALALATVWPGDQPVLLIEADPAGGTLGAIMGWPPEPGLVSLAAAVRRHRDIDTVWAHCQRLPGGQGVLVAPPSADQAASVLGMLQELLGHVGHLDAQVLVDCGRLSGVALPPWWTNADSVLLVARPQLADLQALAVWLEAHPMEARRMDLVLVGRGYPDHEVADALGMAVVGRLPVDADAVGLLATVPATARRLRASPLMRSAHSLAERLAQELDASEPTGAERGVHERLSGTRRFLRRSSVPQALNGTAPHEVVP